MDHIAFKRYFSRCDSEASNVIWLKYQNRGCIEIIIDANIHYDYKYTYNSYATQVG